MLGFSYTPAPGQISQNDYLKYMPNCSNFFLIKEFTRTVVNTTSILVKSSQNLVLIFAFGCPTHLPNFIPIKACVSELEIFFVLVRKEQ